jgi:carbon-monoxide dehydrogenase iron sulfur subunit
MARKFVVSDPDKCTGCRLCELVCSAVKEKGFSPLLSRIRTVRTEDAFLNMSVACRLCTEPTCVKSCPRKALKKDEESGVILVDQNRCSGCSWCVEACEFGAVVSPLEKSPVAICDLCGGDPKCVEFCPKDALSLKTAEEIGQSMRRKTVKKLLEESLKTNKKVQ